MPAGSTTEAAITRGIVKRIDALPGAYARKVPGTRYGGGWPDVVGCIAGTFLALEVKRPDQPYGVTPLQARELGRWESAGAIAGVVTSWGDVRDLLQEHGVLVP